MTSDVRSFRHVFGAQITKSGPRFEKKPHIPGDFDRDQDNFVQTGTRSNSYVPQADRPTLLETQTFGGHEDFSCISFDDP